MTARFHKKVRRMRGSHTHGWGEKKKHRGAGSRAGRGKSNWLYSKRSYTYAYEPERLGKKGFVLRSKSKRVPSINVMDIDSIAKAKNLTEVDVAALGYVRVLGDGQITKPLTVKAPQITAKARAKIEEAGGKAVETAPRSEEKKGAK